MTDLNFNPGIGISKPLFKDNRYIGKATFIIEHESNGRDSIWSRSWNRIALSANLMITNNIMAHGKIWMPIVDGENNKNIVRYCGFSQFGMQYLTENRRFVSGITVTLRHKFGSFNITAGFGYRIFKSDNQFIYAQYYNGYGEGMLDYNKFHSQLRVGLLIRPKFFSDF